MPIGIGNIDAAGNHHIIANGDMVCRNNLQTGCQQLWLPISIRAAAGFIRPGAQARHLSARGLDMHIEVNILTPNFQAMRADNFSAAADRGKLGDVIASACKSGAQVTSKRTE